MRFGRAPLYQHGRATKGKVEIASINRGDLVVANRPLIGRVGGDSPSVQRRSAHGPGAVPEGNRSCRRSRGCDRRRQSHILSE